MTSYISRHPKATGELEETSSNYIYIMSQPSISILAAPRTLDQTQIQYWRDEGFAADLNEVSDFSQAFSALEILQKKNEKYGIIGTIHFES